MKKKVSVIIPVFNAEEYLAECLDSVLGQTLRDIEIICVNDGSTDGSLEILRKYARCDSRISVITQENKGAGAARNYGMAKSTGEYLSFLDADDFFELNMLELAYEKAKEEEADLIVFQSNQYYMKENQYVDTPWAVREKGLPPYTPFTYRQLRGNVFKVFVGWAWDKLFRREFVIEHRLRFQEQRTTNDMLFVFSALVLANRVTVLKKILVHQRRDAQDSLSKTRENSWYCFYDALIALRMRLQAEDLYGELERDFINYALHACLWNINTLAEPTKSKLLRKLNLEWSSSLGIADKSDEYFYNLKEYVQYTEILRRESIEFVGKLKSLFRISMKDQNIKHAACMYTTLQKMVSSCELLKEGTYTFFAPEAVCAGRAILHNSFEMMKTLTAHPLLISMTSYPARIHDVNFVLQTIDAQSMQPDAVVLWLAESEFPGKESSLPYELRERMDLGKLQIRWCDDLKSHKKYYYMMQEYPEAVVVTINDDILYEETMLEKLWCSYLLFPRAVSASRVHVMGIESDGTVFSYTDWMKEVSSWLQKPSMQLMATGGAGTLYPPHLLDKAVFDKQAIRENCLWADDLWLKVFEILGEIPVVQICEYPGIKYVPASQKEGLFQKNVNDGQNDVQYQKVRCWLFKKYGRDILGEKLVELQEKGMFMSEQELYQCFNGQMAIVSRKLKQTWREKSELGQQLRDIKMENNQLRSRIKKMENSKSYKLASKIGRIYRTILK